MFIVIKTAWVDPFLFHRASRHLAILQIRRKRS